MRPTGSVSISQFDVNAKRARTKAPYKLYFHRKTRRPKGEGRLTLLYRLDIYSDFSMTLWVPPTKSKAKCYSTPESEWWKALPFKGEGNYSGEPGFPIWREDFQNYQGWRPSRKRPKSTGLYKDTKSASPQWRREPGEFESDWNRKRGRKPVSGLQRGITCTMLLLPILYTPFGLWRFFKRHSPKVLASQNKA